MNNHPPGSTVPTGPRMIKGPSQPQSPALPSMTPTAVLSVSIIVAAWVAPRPRPPCRR
jgi:hypothetical protein